MTGTAVVVGGGRGIGRAIAVELARDEGVERLVVADVDLELAQETAAAGSGDAECVARRVDLAEPASVQELFAASREATRVAIPGGVFSASPSLELEREEMERILRINLVGCYHAAQLYAGAMASSGGGAIVGIASIAARMPRMRQAAYSASKAGLRQALRVLAMEVAGDGVRINTVSPGPTDTPMMRELASDHSSVDDLAQGSALALRPRIPVGRVATSEDIAVATRFLLSPGAAHIVMQDLVVDGGELLGM
ncbi:SDR family NAD(P)-dependent oxidoreductase [Conexibacter woesei]|uniref:Short-chain dehydrogenase/reductase SDR n=1 Tax=Conexibacter woesei (strain DSM 14684 / CCUG 47730 / CIP 108061 / JCM 11494 / NBRC 100937 / ID131577) TaxID=469383 RepID=D3F534_CONWI|nr:SDR family oxidoreductase [Conexibacter woesei]ADB48612.1 short-chain dehydrogenase/reductase SDR [Conexibacter woesei DSM 14684]